MVRELKIKSVKWNHKLICLSLFLAFGKHVFIYRGFPDNSVGKESACSAGDTSLIPGSGRSAGEGIGYPLQYSWASLVAQLVKNYLQCGRPGFDPWVGKIPWRRGRLPTPVFWPTEFHGLYSPWGHKELDRTEQLSLFIYVCVCIYIHIYMYIYIKGRKYGVCVIDTQREREGGASMKRNLENV